jgi:hypothetical protein
MVRVVTGIRVKKRRVYLPAGSSLGREWCEDADDGCCPSGTGTGTGTGTGQGVPCNPYVPDACGDCEPDSSPLQWTLRVAGVTNAACADCTGYNGTWTLWHLDGCVWDTDDASTRCGDPSVPTWTLSYNAGLGRWQLVAGGSQAVYETDAAHWNCCEPNGMALAVANPDVCGGWPARLELLPVGDCTGCPDGVPPTRPGTVATDCCPGVLLPTRLYATLSNGATGTIPLNWDATSSRWESGASAICGHASEFLYLECVAGVWTLSGGLADCNPVSSPTAAATASCAPVAFVFTGLSGTCCAGTFDCTVTA